MVSVRCIVAVFRFVLGLRPFVRVIKTPSNRIMCDFERFIFMIFHFHSKLITSV